MAQQEHAMEHEHEHKQGNIFLNTSVQLVSFFSLTAVILFVTLMTAYPPVHDFFHGLRHALMIIPCH